jgi:flagellar FliL protein
MAEEKQAPEGEKKDEASAPSGGGAKAWLPLIVSIVLMPALAFGMTKFVIVPQLQKSLGIKETTEKPGGEKGKKGEGKKVNVPFNKILVNIAGTMGQRYLLVSLSIASTGGEEFKTKLTEQDAPLRDMAMGVLSTKTLADLEKPGARNLIRTELMNGFSNILGDGAVSDIYITEFGIQ